MTSALSPQRLRPPMAGLAAIDTAPRALPRQDLVDALSVPVYTTDADGYLTYYNDAAAECWGWRPPLHQQRWTGAWRLYARSGEPLPLERICVSRCLRSGQPEYGLGALVERPDGTRVVAAPYATPLFDAAGRLEGVVCAYVDSSRTHAAELARSALATRFQAVDKLAPEGLLVLEAVRDAAGAFLDLAVSYANANAARLLDLPHERLDGARLGALQIGGLTAGFAEVMASGRSLERELEYRTPAGMVWIRSRTVPHGDGVAVAFEDVSARRAAEARIKALAQEDRLTGLANRHRLQAELAKALTDPATPAVGVLLVDLDNFKQLNDALGHSVGDELLRAVAGRLSRIAPTDALVARMSSDEFAVLLNGPDAGRAEALARRLCTALARRVGLGRLRAATAASIGVAVIPPGAREITPDGVLREAGLALQAAKQAGRNRIRLFVPALAAATEQRQRMQLALQRALATHQLSLAYQPVFDLRQDCLVGFEALLRWQHPELGAILPGEFIPLAEETGLIVPIGEWALRRACADAAGWPRGLKVAVNLSPVQFVGAEVVSMVTAALRAAGLPPEQLEIEVTESVLLQQTEQVAETLRRLRAMGVRLALDDFGTGYASLSYLRGFAFDKIKIDQSFVRDAVTRPECLAIVRSVAALAVDLGMTATAEGVEGPEHLAMVRDAGCLEAQGYHLGRPMPLAGLGRWLQPQR